MNVVIVIPAFNEEGGISDTVRGLRAALESRGIEHELVSEGGVTFIEGLAPVPLDHVPDRDRDLVLGPDGGATHVER